MIIHILVEGPSEEALLAPWLKRFQPGHVHRVHKHRGKGRIPALPKGPPNPKHQGLLDQLPAKLRAYGKTLDPDTDRVLVLVDADDENCVELKSSMASLLELCNPAPTCKFRVAVEEVEAFYLGDPTAVRAAFNVFKKGVHQSYEQDSICGTWEVFQAVIGAAREDKVGWAAAMADHLGTKTKGFGRNASPSFVHFCRALRLLAGEPWT